MMNEINPQKYIDKITKKERIDISPTKKYFKNLIIRVLIVTVIFLSLAIVCKSDSSLKTKIYDYINSENISFTKIKSLYDKYLGGVLPLKKDGNTEEVFNETLKYDSISIYHDGVKLSVGDNYLVPSMKEGMVVFIGDKDNYGNTIIIEDLSGVDIWYGNVSNTSLKLYDYVEEGTLLGEANKELFMVFSKDDKYLDYEEYLK